ncbi:MAG: OmpA family protein [Polyangiaceae bacterium]
MVATLKRALSAASIAGLVALSATGCVSKVNFDRCVAGAAKVKADADAREKDAEGKQKDASARIQDLQQQLAAAEAATQDRDSKLSELSTASHNMQAQLDEATAINQQLRAELGHLGKDVDKILAERGTLSKSLSDAKIRLAELRNAQAAAEQRTLLFRDFERRFQALIKAGQVGIVSRRGRLVMVVDGDLLFDKGRSDLRKAGKGTLMEIAHALHELAQPSAPRRFLVTDDVDDAPFKSKVFESAWSLTAARGVSVVTYLVSLGVSPTSLTAAGAGSFDSLVPNDTPENRAKNRRVEIALLPSADETIAPAPSPAAASVPTVHQGPAPGPRAAPPL